MTSFNDFVHNCKLRNKATSNEEIELVLSSIELDNVGVYLKDGPLSSDIGIFIIHPSKGTRWVVYIIENFFDSYGCSPPQKLSKFIIKRKGHCLYSEHKTQSLTNS